MASSFLSATIAAHGQLGRVLAGDRYLTDYGWLVQRMSKDDGGLARQRIGRLGAHSSLSISSPRNHQTHRSGCAPDHATAGPRGYLVTRVDAAGGHLVQLDGSDCFSVRVSDSVNSTSGSHPCQRPLRTKKWRGSPARRSGPGERGGKPVTGPRRSRARPSSRIEHCGIALWRACGYCPEEGHGGHSVHPGGMERKAVLDEPVCCTGATWFEKK